MFLTKLCKKCSKEFLPNSGSQIRCDNCRYSTCLICGRYVKNDGTKVCSKECKEIARTSNIFYKKRKIPHTCKYCKEIFYAADVKANRCLKCKHSRCENCGKRCGKFNITNRCFKCSKKLLTPQKILQLEKLHKGMVGENNPSKRGEVRKKISSGLKLNHPARNLKYRDKYIKRGIELSQSNSISKVEKYVGEFLVGFYPQVQIGNYCVDYLQPHSKVILEVFGCMWHCCPSCKIQYNIENRDEITNRDKLRIEYLKSLGYAVIVIWEHEIYHNKSNLKEYLKDVFNREGI